MALILIADDDELVRDIVQHILNARGHAVGAVENGAEAVRVAERKHPDLVILDCSMPGLGGVEALRRIRSSPAIAAMPVLMLTARVGHWDENIAWRAGASDYIHKPFDPDELVARVEALLHQQARVRQAS